MTNQFGIVTDEILLVQTVEDCAVDPRNQAGVRLLMVSLAMFFATAWSPSAWSPGLSPMRSLRSASRKRASVLAAEEEWFGTHAEKFQHDAFATLKSLWSPASRGEEYRQVKSRPAWALP